MGSTEVVWSCPLETDLEEGTWSITLFGVNGFDGVASEEAEEED